MDIGVRLGIETTAGIAIPVPGATDIASGVEHPHRQAEFAQANELEHTVDTGADDDRIVALGAGWLGLRWLRHGVSSLVH